MDDNTDIVDRLRSMYYELSRRQASTPFGERSELDGIPALLYEAAIKIQDLQGNEIERLRNERDEARRLLKAVVDMMRDNMAQIATGIWKPFTTYSRRTTMLDKQSLAELADIYKEKYNRLLKDNEELERQVDEANAEIKRLRQENATLTAEHDALRAERDEVRQSYCSLMEAYRGGNGRVTANKLGWGYLFEEDKP